MIGRLAALIGTLVYFIGAGIIGYNAALTKDSHDPVYAIGGVLFLGIFPALALAAVLFGLFQAIQWVITGRWP
jgi:hypothetical protein